MSDNEDPGDKYTKRYSRISIILKQVIPILTITLLSSMLAGFILVGMKDSLEILPGLLVMIPGLLATRGNIYGVLGSRLSTCLHLGIIEPRFTLNKRFLNIIYASLISNAIISLVISVFAYIALLIFAKSIIPFWALAFISFVSGMISGIILSFLVSLFDFLGFKKGIDPDNIHGPVATVSGDIFSTLALFITAELVVDML